MEKQKEKADKEHTKKEKEKKKKEEEKKKAQSSGSSHRGSKYKIDPKRITDLKLDAKSVPMQSITDLSVF